MSGKRCVSGCKLFRWGNREKTSKYRQKSEFPKGTHTLFPEPSKEGELGVVCAGRFGNIRTGTSLEDRRGKGKRRGGTVVGIVGGSLQLMSARGYRKLRLKGKIWIVERLATGQRRKRPKREKRLRKPVPLLLQFLQSLFGIQQKNVKRICGGNAGEKAKRTLLARGV